MGAHCTQSLAYSVGVSEGPQRTPATGDAARTRGGVLQVTLMAIPLPLAFLALLARGEVALLMRAALAVCVAALVSALASHWFAERRMHQDVAQHAKELAHTKRQILALVSHELRTPVTGMVGFSRTLSGRFDDLDQDTLRLFVDAIDEHSNRLSRLIDNVVIASRTPLVVASGNCQLSRALAKAVVRVGLRPEREDCLQIRLDGPLEARIDEEAAVRILTNLLDNALKFGDPDARVYVDGEVCDGRVLLYVGNAGPAIPLGLRSALYEPFVQGDTTDTRAVDGLGLGLHVVRHLVEAYGGSIDLVDHPRLVVFRVSLPATVTGTTSTVITHARATVVPAARHQPMAG